MSQITYTDKEDLVVTSVPEVNKITAGDMNEIKNSVNALYVLLESATKVIRKQITAADFEGYVYPDSDLVGLTPDVDFLLFTDNGDSVLLKDGVSYDFDAESGEIDVDAGNYRLIIFKNLL